mmetsp:Transcript_5450/g.13655  ORF Transcript_5450/g.13655 Transcript_5450/m.13655 type:complete len:252 (-) Transcript_5450:111-866(-)
MTMAAAWTSVVGTATTTMIALDITVSKVQIMTKRTINRCIAAMSTSMRSTTCSLPPAAAMAASTKTTSASTKTTTDERSRSCVEPTFASSPATPKSTPPRRTSRDVWGSGSGASRPSSRSRRPVPNSTYTAAARGYWRGSNGTSRRGSARPRARRSWSRCRRQCRVRATVVRNILPRSDSRPFFRGIARITRCAVSSYRLSCSVIVATSRCMAEEGETESLPRRWSRSTSSFSTRGSRLRWRISSLRAPNV